MADAAVFMARCERVLNRIVALRAARRIPTADAQELLELASAPLEEAGRIFQEMSGEYDQLAEVARRAVELGKQTAADLEAAQQEIAQLRADLVAARVQHATQVSPVAAIGAATGCRN